MSSFKQQFFNSYYDRSVWIYDWLYIKRDRSSEAAEFREGMRKVVVYDQLEQLQYLELVGRLGIWVYTVKRSIRCAYVYCISGLLYAEDL